MDDNIKVQMDMKDMKDMGSHYLGLTRGEKLCAGILEKVAKATLIIAVEQKTDLYRSADNALRNTMSRHRPSIQRRKRSR
ncbi:hypothetical protein PV325_007614, partial [Microctonus aethiopoides]